MRIAKKIIFIVLALLPIASLVVFCLCNVGAETSASYVPLGTLEFTDGAQGLTIVTTPNSITSWVIDPIFNEKPLTGVFKAVAGLLMYLETNIGLPVCLPTFATFVYILYLSFIGLVDMIVSLITFVPRKCGEIFGGKT